MSTLASSVKLRLAMAEAKGPDEYRRSETVLGERLLVLANLRAAEP